MALLLCLLLPRYNNWALKEWQWFSQSGMINSEYLINDGLSSSCQNNNGNVFSTPSPSLVLYLIVSLSLSLLGITWTYNQGVVLGGLIYLAQITNDSQYLVTATKLANASTTLLVTSSGILQESCDIT